MSEVTVPTGLRVAARRAFIRTTAQAYAATLTTGVSASAVLAIVAGEVDVTATAVTLAVAVVSPVLAGAAAALSIIGHGLPDEYTHAG